MAAEKQLTYIHYSQTMIAVHELPLVEIPKVFFKKISEIS